MLYIYDMLIKILLNKWMLRIFYLQKNLNVAEIAFKPLSLSKKILSARVMYGKSII